MEGLYGWAFGGEAPSVFAKNPLTFDRTAQKDRVAIPKLLSFYLLSTLFEHIGGRKAQLEVSKFLQDLIK